MTSEDERVESIIGSWKLETNERMGWVWTGMKCIMMVGNLVMLQSEKVMDCAVVCSGCFEGLLKSV